MNDGELKDLYRRYVRMEMECQDDLIRHLHPDLRRTYRPSRPLSLEEFERVLLAKDLESRDLFVERLRAGYWHAVETWAGEIADRTLDHAEGGGRLDRFFRR